MIDESLAVLMRDATELKGSQVRPSSETLNVFRDPLPAVVYTLIDIDRGRNDDGLDGVATAMYQLDIFASKMTAARQIADQIRNAMDNFRGKAELDDEEIEPAIQLIRFDGRDRYGVAEHSAGQNQVPARYIQLMTVTYRE